MLEPLVAPTATLAFGPLSLEQLRLVLVQLVPQVRILLLVPMRVYLVLVGRPPVALRLLAQFNVSHVALVHGPQLALQHAPSAMLGLGLLFWVQH